MNGKGFTFEEYVNKSWDESKKIELIMNKPSAQTYEEYGKLLPFLKKAEDIAIQQSDIRH